MKDLQVYNNGAILGRLRVDAIPDNNVGNFTVMETYLLDDREIEALDSDLEVELAEDFKKIPKTFNDIITFATDNSLDLRVSNADGSNAEFVVGGIAIDQDTLPDGTVGVAYSETITASGGSGSFDFFIVSGSLPSQLALNNDTGVISGTPDTAETATFTIRAIDETSGLSVDKELSITINAA